MPAHPYIPDRGTGDNDIQSNAFSIDWEVQAAAMARVDYIVSGCEATQQGSPDMTVACSAGAVVSNGVYLTVSSGNWTIGTANATNPRIDLLVITSSGTKAVRAGTAAAAPKPPARTANDVVCGHVYVPANDTTITDGQITRGRLAYMPPDQTTVAVTPSDSQNDYAPTGIAKANVLRVNASASIKLTGIAATYDGHALTIINASTDYLLWLENQNTASTAANRFILPDGFPAWLMPGASITLGYDGTTSRWRVLDWPTRGQGMGLTLFSDCIGGTGTANLASAGGGLTVFASGTGAAAAASTYLANTTERPLGIIQLTSGTTATGRAGIGDNGTDQIIPTLGPALSVARLAVQTTVSGTETFQVLSGFIDSLAAGATTDGVAWNNRWNGSAAEWSQDRWAATTATRTTTDSPTPDNNYIWCVVFVNPGWTRADFIYSTDSVSFTVASSPTTGFPSSTQRTSWCPAQIIKSAGTTARLVAVDLAGYRVDYVRG